VLAFIQGYALGVGESVHWGGVRALNAMVLAKYLVPRTYATGCWSWEPTFFCLGTSDGTEFVHSKSEDDPASDTMGAFWDGKTGLSRGALRERMMEEI
jgi:hypothetical protein